MAELAGVQELHIVDDAEADAVFEDIANTRFLTMK